MSLALQVHRRFQILTLNLNIVIYIQRLPETQCQQQIKHLTMENISKNRTQNPQPFFIPALELRPKLIKIRTKMIGEFFFYNGQHDVSGTKKKSKDKMRVAKIKKFFCYYFFPGPHNGGRGRLRISYSLILSQN